MILTAFHGIESNILAKTNNKNKTNRYHVTFNTEIIFGHGCGVFARKYNAAERTIPCNTHGTNKRLSLSIIHFPLPVFWELIAK